MAIKKAYIIVGGTRAAREQKYQELFLSDKFNIFGSFRPSDEPDKLAVMFCDTRDDFDTFNFTFGAIRRIVCDNGNVTLPANYDFSDEHPKTQTSIPFGIIRIK